MPSITNLATNATISTVEKKILKVSDLVKKADYDAKIKDIEKNLFLLLMIIINLRMIYKMKR